MNGKLYTEKKDMKHADNSILIRRYEPESDDEEMLFQLLKREGDEWQDSWKGEGRSAYQKALCSSITYLLFDGTELCGFARCRDDNGFGFYVYDLLVDKKQRGKEYGRMLMEQAYHDFPNDLDSRKN